MKNILASSMFALSLATSGLAYAEPVKIGVITTLSGGGAGLGVDMRDAFTLAMKQSGNKDVELVIEDDAQKPEIAVQLAEKMIQSDKVDLLTGIIWSNLAMAVVPNAVAQDVIYLSPNAGPSALAGAKCNKNYFNVAYQNDNFHEAMGQYANKDYKKTFILAPNYPAGKDSLTGFKRYYKGELAGEAYTQIGQADYAAEIAQIRDSGADSVFFFLPGGMGISFMKQYAQSGVNIPVMGPGFSFDQDILPAVGDAALGVKNSASWSRDLDNEANKQFVEAFKAEYNRLPSIYAAQSWDTANLILSALSKASVKDKDAFRAALKAADFKSVRGEFTFNTNNHPVQNIYVREVVKEGDVLTNKIIATAFEHHKDAYADQCKM
ncbi:MULTISPECIES: ABC transporter substrate-binding protein [Mesorhizobium]|jgi:branched-chain amino acid transport system substrate-binding protein|uniref:ABC transporter substrate-binding protein n=1 Tax=Mesorhizobium TaxID=68287 RepID=UPI000FCA375A|nr:MULTISPECIES: ABC transporter substrate-binding protein [Mesorhizobium]RUU59418.1 ABC transporter substrate-binding protein [Mesorhizobium sp. M7A.T.Ca.TU.009.01.1.1]RVB35990.1 ABC transporter substrate-binding protein [Mesorhizobium sp. M7A.F.Ca.CA.004.05.1.1]AZV22684.1 ABC transporter substrate-binding protein [Mesorhizobium sp. M7A.F.Ce.TU.012.03.2.1]MCF6127101.1 ABC transporter substrate-binding protein [Mesorhizobium ciceri]MCQ8813657.1 ABC transporter substrate-binding protein [Mesorh